MADSVIQDCGYRAQATTGTACMKAFRKYRRDFDYVCGGRPIRWAAWVRKWEAEKPDAEAAGNGKEPKGNQSGQD